MIDDEAKPEPTPHSFSLASLHNLLKLLRDAMY
jgi:hypothetical protein